LKLVDNPDGCKREIVSALESLNGQAAVRGKIAARAALLRQAQLSAMLKELRNSIEQSRSYPSRFPVNDGKKEILLPVEKVDWIEASAYYCGLHTDGRTYMLRETITDLSNKPDPRQFAFIDVPLSISTEYVNSSGKATAMGPSYS
jgi:DNA-binding LytR/AlgR family response regulator